MYKNKEKARIKQKEYRLKNKEKIKIAWKKYYEKNQVKIKAKRKTKRHKEYKHKQYLKHKDKIILRHRVYKKKNPWIYAYLLIKNRALKFHLKSNLNKEDFYNWYQNQEKICVYCDLTNLSLSLIRKNLKRFTVDRKDNHKGYTINNICFACSTCNLLKSSVFSFQEWKQIAQKYIKPKWKRLEKDGQFLPL